MPESEYEVVDGVPIARTSDPLRLRVAHVDQANTVLSGSDGDLWPSAWADDGGLYTAAGDGTGFARHGWSDILVNRIDGTPQTGLRGERLSDGDAVGPLWDAGRYNRKPTGMVAVPAADRTGPDVLYLAVQDLRCGDSADTFNEAPRATVVRSDDRGRTWSWPAEPMFTDHVFTTIMFLDLGQSNGGSEWVYAYGIDGNWRTSFSHVVPDPTELFLARVPAASVQDRSMWEFYAGGDARRWSVDIDDRVPVFADGPRVEVRVDGEWMPASAVTVVPPYRNDFTALEEDEYVFDFEPVCADGVRIVGVPGGRRDRPRHADIEGAHQQERHR